MRHYLAALALLFTSLSTIEGALIVPDAGSCIQPYVSGFAGANWLDVTSYDDFKFSYQAGPSLSGAIGLKATIIDPPADFYLAHLFSRTELQVTYRSNKFSHVTYQGLTLKPRARYTSTTVLVNSYCDFLNPTGFIPYVGLGIGGSFQELKVKLKSSSESSKASGFCTQLMGGVMKSLDDHVTLGLEYRYLHCWDESSNQTLGLTLSYFF